MKTLSPLPLTTKEKSVLEYIESCLGDNGVAPSYQEIKDHFGFASNNSVQNYVKQLINKGYIQLNSHQKRAIQILHGSQAVQKLVQMKTRVPFKEPSAELSLQSSQEKVLSLPLLGRVAAGCPIEEFTHNETIDVPPSLVRNGDKTFALQVRGQSMIEDGIFDGDIILVQKQAHASNGEIVVASVDNESTVKRFYLQNKKDSIPEKIVELRPANSEMKSMWYPPDVVNIQGIVVGLIRKF